MSQNILAGLLAGLLLAVLFAVYLALRGRSLVAFFQGLDPSIAALSTRTLTILVWASFMGASLLFGALAGVIYTLIGDPLRFTLLALGGALLFSLLAVLSKTPLTGDKIFWNLAVGLVLGLLVPLI